jgi:hypothetical protein
MYSVIGALPAHRYVWVDTAHTHREPIGFAPAVWFGLHAFPGRAWGCTVMLESGALYRSLPPHALATRAQDVAPLWDVSDAQTWDCYGERFATLAYPYLTGLDCLVRAGRPAMQYAGEYWFTIAPAGDGFSAAPDQAKEFTVVSLENGRLTIQPTNHIVFRERSFTAEPLEFPRGLKRCTDTWSCE